MTIATMRGSFGHRWLQGWSIHHDLPALSLLATTEVQKYVTANPPYELC